MRIKKKVKGRAIITYARIILNTLNYTKKKVILMSSNGTNRQQHKRDQRERELKNKVKGKRKRNKKILENYTLLTDSFNGVGKREYNVSCETKPESWEDTLEKRMLPFAFGTDNG